MTRPWAALLKLMFFNKLLTKFKKINFEVYELLNDYLKSHNIFNKKFKIKLKLLADDKLKIEKKLQSMG
tara:strand:- start:296 stop:502 length:207 start_codon:yes stop_codon:yes gene_type:complete